METVLIPTAKTIKKRQQQSVKSDTALVLFGKKEKKKGNLFQSEKKYRLKPSTKTFSRKCKRIEDSTADMPMITGGPASATLDAEKLTVLLEADGDVKMIPGTDLSTHKDRGKLNLNGKISSKVTSTSPLKKGRIVHRSAAVKKFLFYNIKDFI